MASPHCGCVSGKYGTVGESGHAERGLYWGERTKYNLEPVTLQSRRCQVAAGGVDGVSSELKGLKRRPESPTCALVVTEAQAADTALT